MDVVQNLQALADRLKKDFTEGQKDKLDAALAQIESTVAAAIEMSKEVKLTAVLQDPDLLHCGVISMRKDQGYGGRDKHVYANLMLNGDRFVFNGSETLPPTEERIGRIIILMYKKPKERS